MSSRDIRNLFDALRADHGLPPRIAPSCFVAPFVGVAPGPLPDPGLAVASDPTIPSTPTSGPGGPRSS